MCRLSTRQKFRMTLLVFCTGVVCGFHKLQLPAIRDVVTKYYQVSDIWVYFTSLLFPLAFLLFAFPSKHFIRHFGLRVTISTAALFNLVGALCKCFFLRSHHYTGILLGQIFPAFANLLFYFSIPLLTTLWFNENQFTLAATFCYSALYIGAMCAYVQPEVLHAQLREDDETLLHLVLMSVLLAAVASAVFILTLLFMKEAPNTDADLSIFKTRMDAIETDFELAKGKNRVLFSLGICTAHAIGITLLTVLNQMMLPLLNQTPNFLTLVAILFTLSGCSGLYVFALLMKRFKRFYLVLMASVSTCIFIGLMSSFAKEGQQYYVIALFALLGFTLLGFQSLNSILCLELYYPSDVNNLLMFFSCLGCLGELGILPIVTNALQKDGPRWTLLLMTIALFISFLPLIFMRYNVKGYQRQVDEDIETTDWRPGMGVEFEVVDDVREEDIGASRVEDSDYLVPTSSKGISVMYLT